MLEFDAAGVERDALLRVMGNLDGKHILEIGSGDGRLTWRYATPGVTVQGLDPKPGTAAAALANRPKSLAQWVRFSEESLETFAGRSAERFDLALLSWSL